MRTLRGLAVAAVLSFGVSSVALAGDVAIKGVHLCCGACVQGVNDALSGVEGVTDVNADRNTKAVFFKATDEKAAKKAIQELADAGFHGTATLDKKELPFPDSGAKKGEKSNTIVITGLHLCCGACVTGVKSALEGLPNLVTQDIDRTARTIKLTGTDIELTVAIAALNKGGFHGTIKTDKK